VILLRKGRAAILFRKCAMSPSPSVLRISPMAAVADMDQTLAFYEEAPGFTPVRRAADDSIVQRDGRAIHFQKAAGEEVLRAMRNHTEFYIEVSAFVRFSEICFWGELHAGDSDAQLGERFSSKSTRGILTARRFMRLARRDGFSSGGFENTFAEIPGNTGFGEGVWWS